MLGYLSLTYYVVLIFFIIFGRGGDLKECLCGVGVYGCVGLLWVIDMGYKCGCGVGFRCLAGTLNVVKPMFAARKKQHK